MCPACIGSYRLLKGLTGAGCICNRMRPSRIKEKFSRVFSKFSQNCPGRVAVRAICENFENTSENFSLILRGLNAITYL